MLLKNTRYRLESSFLKVQEIKQELQDFQKKEEEVGNSSSKTMLISQNNQNSEYEIMQATPIIIIAPQRSGTTAFQRTLAQDKRFLTFGEVFHRKKGNSKSNFFNFLINNPELKQLYCYPSEVNMSKIFHEYFTFLAKEAQKRGVKYFMVDAKQNSLHHFNYIWHDIFQTPGFLELAMQKQIKFIRIKRQNLFDQVISSIIANRIGKWHLKADEQKPLEKIELKIDPANIKRRMEQIENLNNLIDSFLSNYSYVTYLTYEEIFDDNYIKQKVLNELKLLLGEKELKQIPVPLRKTSKSVDYYFSDPQKIYTFFRGERFQDMVFDSLSV